MFYYVVEVLHGNPFIFRALQLCTICSSHTASRPATCQDRSTGWTTLRHGMHTPSADATA